MGEKHLDPTALTIICTGLRGKRFRLPSHASVKFLSVPSSILWLYYEILWLALKELKKVIVWFSRSSLGCHVYSPTFWGLVIEHLCEISVNSAIVTSGKSHQASGSVLCLCTFRLCSSVFPGAINRVLFVGVTSCACLKAQWALKSKSDIIACFPQYQQNTKVHEKGPPRWLRDNHGVYPQR